MAPIFKYCRDKLKARKLEKITDYSLQLFDIVTQCYLNVIFYVNIWLKYRQIYEKILNSKGPKGSV